MAQTNLIVKYTGFNASGKRVFSVKRTCDEVVTEIAETKNGESYRIFYDKALGYQASTTLTDEILEKTQTADGWLVRDASGNVKYFEFTLGDDLVTKTHKKIQREIKTGVSLDGETFKVFKTLLKLDDVPIQYGEETITASEMLELLKIQAMENYENHKEKYEKQLQIEHKKAEMERIAKELAILEASVAGGEASVAGGEKEGE